MKPLLKPFAKVLFYALAAALFIWTGRLTYDLATALLPDMAFAGLFALVLFDFGCIAWLWVFVHYAQGTGQRVTAIILTLLDLIGIGGVSLVELYMGGQSFIEVPPAIPTLAVWVVVIWTFFNIAAVVIFHLASPEAVAEMAMQSERDKLRQESLKLLSEKMNEVAESISHDLAEVLKEQTLEGLVGRNGANPTKEKIGGG